MEKKENPHKANKKRRTEWNNKCKLDMNTGIVTWTLRGTPSTSKNTERNRRRRRNQKNKKKAAQKKATNAQNKQKATNGKNEENKQDRNNAGSRTGDNSISANNRDKEEKTD